MPTMTRNRSNGSRTRSSAAERDRFAPDPKLKFTFGLWTVGNIGRDPFGEPTREKLSLAQICEMLGEVGAYGVNFHDNDAIPIDATQQQADSILREFKQLL